MQGRVGESDTVKMQTRAQAKWKVILLFSLAEATRALRILLLKIPQHYDTRYAQEG